MSLYSREFVHPPLDGSLTIPETLDFHWKHNADLPIYVFSEDGKDTVTEISYLEFGRACHRAAHWISPKVRTLNRRPVVAIIALVDTMVYQAVAVGIMRAGFTPFPISPRNTAAAVINLLKNTDCHYLLASRTTLKELLDGITLELQTGYELLVEEIPSLHDIFPKLGVEREEDLFTPYPAETQRPDVTDLAMYLHSSGSTGFPKAIPQTHEILIHWVKFSCGYVYRDYKPRLRTAGMHLPPFHTLGLYCQVLFPLYSCCTVSLYPPVVDRPDKLPMIPSPETILEHTRRTKANTLVAVPTLLQVWGQDQESVDILSALEFVAYSGGALAPKLADFIVSSGVKLVPVYGATEFGSPTNFFKREEDQEDWTYLEFSDRCKLRWIPQGDGTFECQFLTTETHVLPIENVQDVRGYSTSDLFEPHPTKKHLWKIVGRVDDVIIHASGEKTVPAPIEDIVMSSPYIMGTVMFGRAHDQPGILIEPKQPFAIDTEDDDQVTQFRNLIWPIIDEANKVAPAFSRIFKEMILVTHRNKPLPRAGKGTVLKKVAVQVYDQEIEALYATVESTEVTESVEPPRVWDKGCVTQWLKDHVEELNQGKKVEASDDLFEHGFDSLSATILRRRITGAFQSLKTSSGASALAALNQNTVYTYPTIDALSTFLVSLVSNEAPPDCPKGRVEAIEEMIEKYQFVGRTRVDKFSRQVASATTGLVVLLTGSTGNLGSQVLEALLRDGRVSKVFALNRPSSTPISERHLDRFRDKGLDATLLSSCKLVYIESDVSRQRLGLPESVYHEIRDSVNVIVHNAWRLDFNLSLSSFESNIRGTRNLIELAHSSPHSSDLKFIFTSSVASALSWDQTQGPYPEEVVMDAKYSVGNGYGESKYVTERMLATSGLNFTSLRIGQVSGGHPNGAWAITDWLPILVKSSLTLGVFPKASGVVSWIPMDTVSTCILDLTFSSNSLPPALNVLHPRPIAWNTAMQYIANSFTASKKRTISFLSFPEWVSMLERYASSSADNHAVPAIKLLHFFKNFSIGDKIVWSSGRDDREAGGMTSFSLTNMQNISLSVKELSPLQIADAERWVAYWKEAGLLEV